MSSGQGSGSSCRDLGDSKKRVADNTSDNEGQPSKKEPQWFSLIAIDDPTVAIDDMFEAARREIDEMLIPHSPHPRGKPPTLQDLDSPGDNDNLDLYNEPSPQPQGISATIYSPKILSSRPARSKSPSRDVSRASSKGPSKSLSQAVSSSTTSSSRESSPRTSGYQASKELPDMARWIHIHEQILKGRDERDYMSLQFIRSFENERHAMSQAFSTGELTGPFEVKNVLGKYASISIDLPRKALARSRENKYLLGAVFISDQAVGYAANVHKVLESQDSSVDQSTLPIKLIWWKAAKIPQAPAELDIHAFIQECNEKFGSLHIREKFQKSLMDFGKDLKFGNMVIAGTSLMWDPVNKLLNPTKGLKLAAISLLASLYKIAKICFHWPEWVHSPTEYQIMEGFLPGYGQHSSSNLPKIIRETEFELWNHIGHETLLFSMSPRFPMRQLLTYICEEPRFAPAAIICNYVDPTDRRYPCCNKGVSCIDTDWCGIPNCKDPISTRVQRWFGTHYDERPLFKEKRQYSAFGNLRLYIKRSPPGCSWELNNLSKVMNQANRRSIYSMPGLQDIANICNNLTKRSDDVRPRRLKWISTHSQEPADPPILDLYNFPVKFPLDKFDPGFFTDERWSKSYRTSHFLDHTFQCEQEVGLQIWKYPREAEGHMHAKTLPMALKWFQPAIAQVPRLYQIPLLGSQIGQNWQEEPLSRLLRYILVTHVDMKALKKTIKYVMCFTFETSMMPDPARNEAELDVHWIIDRPQILRYWLIRQFVETLSSQEYPAEPYKDQDFKSELPICFSGSRWNDILYETHLRRMVLAGKDIWWKNLPYGLALPHINSLYAVFCLRSQIPIRQVLAGMMADRRDIIPAVIFCERSDSADKEYWRCQTIGCRDQGLEAGVFTCRDPNCKDPNSPNVQKFFHDNYTGFALTQHHYVFGTLYMYLRNDLVKK